jgi:hypothetical protein
MDLQPVLSTLLLRSVIGTLLSIDPWRDDPEVPSDYESETSDPEASYL